jgi:hypothetical protein
MLYGNKIRQLRGKKQMLQRQFVAALEINTPVCSKIKRCEHHAKREQIITFAKIFKVNPSDFLSLWLGCSKSHNFMSDSCFKKYRYFIYIQIDNIKIDEILCEIKLSLYLPHIIYNKFIRRILYDKNKMTFAKQIILFEHPTRRNYMSIAVNVER